MNPKRIIVTVSPNGDVVVEADGYRGAGCEAATKCIRDALGTTTTNKRKPEYNMQEASHEQHRVVR